MCRVIFSTFISASRRSNAALLFRLPSLEVTAGWREIQARRRAYQCARRSGRLARLVTCCARGRAARDRVKDEPSAPKLYHLVAACAFFLPFFFFSPTPDRSAPLFPCRREGEKGGEHEGGFTYSLFSIPPHVSAVIAF